METGNTNDLVTIDIYKLSCELAYKKLLEHYRFFNSEKTEEEIEQLIHDEHYEIIDEVQDMYNDFYDEFYTIIKKLVL